MKSFLLIRLLPMSHGDFSDTPVSAGSENLQGSGTSPGLDDALRVLQSHKLPPDGAWPVNRSVPPIILFILDWEIPAFVRGPNATNSLSTREEGEFDYHLDPQLSLKKVVHVPSLLQNLQIPVDKLLDRAFATPHPSTPFATEMKEKTLHTSNLFPKRREINNEFHIQETYQDETFRICSILATSLLFPSAAWREPTPFCWTLSPDNIKAKADGRMYTTEESASFLSPNNREELQTVKRWMLPSYLSWEFKNMTLGSRAQMEYFLDNTNEFVWPRCEGWDGQGGCSVASHKGKKGLPNICGRPTTFDANICPEWKFESSGAQFHCESRPKDEKLRTNASRMMTQLWSEAVMDDSTFVCLNAGNFEILGIRHRATQTLFLSDIVDVANQEQYINLKTSLYVAAILDAYSRARNMDAILPSGKFHPSFFKDLQGYKGVYPRNVLRKIAPQKQRYRKDYEVREREAKKERVLLHQSILYSLNSADKIVVETHSDELLWLVGGRDGTRPDFAAGSFRDTTGDPLWGHQSPLSLVIHRRLKGKVYSASVSLRVGATNVQSNNIIVKVFEKGDRVRCLNEWTAYCHLRNNIVPTCYGVFRVPLDPANGGINEFYLLLLEDCGVSFEDISKSVTKEEWVSLQAKLEMAHCEGFLHQSIDHSHVLRHSPGDIRLINFGRTDRLNIRRHIFQLPPTPSGQEVYPYTDHNGWTYFLPPTDAGVGLATQQYREEAEKLNRCAANDIYWFKMMNESTFVKKKGRTRKARNSSVY